MRVLKKPEELPRRMSRRDQRKERKTLLEARRDLDCAVEFSKTSPVVKWKIKNVPYKLDPAMISGQC